MLKLQGRFGQLWQSKRPTQKDGLQFVVTLHKTTPDHHFTAISLSPRGDFLAAVDGSGNVYVLHLLRQVQAKALHVCARIRF